MFARDFRPRQPRKTTQVAQNISPPETNSRARSLVLCLCGAGRHKQNIKMRDKYEGPQGQPNLLHKTPGGSFGPRRQLFFGPAGPGHCGVRCFWPARPLSTDPRFKLPSGRQPCACKHGANRALWGVACRCNMVGLDCCSAVRDLAAGQVQTKDSTDLQN